LILSVFPSTDEINKPFSIRLNSLNGSEVDLHTAAFTFSIVITEEFDSSAIGVRVLGFGVAYDTSPVSVERFYLVETALQTTIGRTVTITLESLTGNADLYVNPLSRGYFRYTAGTSSEASWSSVSDLSTEMLTIDPGEGGGIVTFCVTVRCRSECAYTLRGGNELGVTTLLEGSSVELSVGPNSYRYFQFFDNLLGGADIIFSLRGARGDPDLYISCQLVPTFDADGFPSSRFGHNILYSSSSYSADIVYISSTDSHCAGGVYYAAVFGYSWDDSAVDFALSAKHRAAVTTLIPGVPSSDSLPVGHQGKYRVWSGSAGGKMTISLSISSGDATL
jgi:hypothetical protein